MLKKASITKHIYFLMIITSMLTAILFAIRYSIYGYKALIISIIPLLFSFLMLFSKKNKSHFNRISIVMINSIMFIRFTLLYLVSSEDYVISFIEISNFFQVIILLILEMIAIFIVFSIFLKQKHDRYSKIDVKNSRFNYPLVIILFFAFLSFILYPNSTIKIAFPFAITSEISENPSGIIIFVNMAIDLLYVLTIVTIKRVRLINTKGRIFLTFIISAIFLLTKWSSTGENISRWSFLIYSLVVITLITKFYPEFKNRIYFYFLPIIGLVIVYLTSLKFSYGSNLLDSIFNSFTLDAYFNGPLGIGAGILTKMRFINDISFSTFLTDIFSAIPFASSLFDGNYNTTVYFFHLTINRTDQIIPMIAQGYIYFGIIGSWLFSFLFLFIIIKIDSLLMRTNNAYIYFALLLLIVWLSCFMALNVNILQESIWRRLIFLAFTYLNLKLVFQRNQKNIKFAERGN